MVEVAGVPGRGTETSLPSPKRSQRDPPAHSPIGPRPLGTGSPSPSSEREVKGSGVISEVRRKGGGLLRGSGQVRRRWEQGRKEGELARKHALPVTQPNSGERNKSSKCHTNHAYNDTTLLPSFSFFSPILTRISHIYGNGN